MELQDKVNLMHFKRRASFDQARAEDCTRLKRYNEGFNKAMSGPSLIELPLAAVGNVSQPAHSPIVECTAMMHSEMEGQKKVIETNLGKLPKTVKMVAVGKEKRKFPLTHSREEMKVVENEREKRKIHLKRSASCDLTVAYVTFQKVRQRSM